jgi:hypothetical protein
LRETYRANEEAGFMLIIAISSSCMLGKAQHMPCTSFADYRLSRLSYIQVIITDYWACRIE